MVEVVGTGCGVLAPNAALRIHLEVLEVVETKSLLAQKEREVDVIPGEFHTDPSETLRISSGAWVSRCLHRAVWPSRQGARSRGWSRRCEESGDNSRVRGRATATGCWSRTGGSLGTRARNTPQHATRPAGVVALCFCMFLSVTRNYSHWMLSQCSEYRTRSLLTFLRSAK